MVSIGHHSILIGEYFLLYAPLFLGAYLIFFLMKIPNLSIETAFLTGALTGFFSSLYIPNTGFPIASCFLGLITAFGGGFAVGVMTALIQRYGAISHLLSSIIIMGFMRGCTLFVMRTSHMPVTGAHNFLRYFSSQGFYAECMCMVLVTGIVIFLLYLFFKTELGMLCAFYGDNPLFLKKYKISTVYTVSTGLGIGNGCAGISGYLVAQYNGFIDRDMGMGLPLVCLTAVMLGATIVSGKARITVIQPLIGGFFYFVIQSLLLTIGFDVRYFSLVQAVVLAGIFFLKKDSSETVGV